MNQKAPQMMIVMVMTAMINHQRKTVKKRRLKTVRAKTIPKKVRRNQAPIMWEEKI
jgi:hypothetical protein